MPQAPALWSGGLHCFWGNPQVFFKKIYAAIKRVLQLVL